MPTLYEIAQEYQALDDLIAESGGDVTDEAIDEIITTWLEQMQGDLENKVDGYCAVVREMEARAKARAEEASRLTDLVNTDMNAVKRLKDRLKTHLQIIGEKKVQTRRFTTSVCGNGGALPIKTNEDNVSPEYMQWVSEIDSKRIREDLENGVELSFARLMERGTHLRIK